MTIGKPFAPGNPGKPVGTRTRLTNSVLKILADAVDEHFAPVDKIVRIENPLEWRRGIIDLVKALLPRELAVTNAKLGDISDEEITALLAHVREEMKNQAAQRSAAIEDHEDHGNEFIH